MNARESRLKGRIVGGYNFTWDNKGDYKNFFDNCGHGTHVAGIIAASENGSGIIGVAPEAGLLILKAVSGNGVGEINHLIKAIDYAVSWRGTGGERVNIISMSMGTPEDVPMLHEVIKKAVNANILVVSSAGNEGDGKLATSEIQYPAYYKEVVAVGAVDANGSLAPFSSTNNEVDILAPGVKILSTFLKGTYAELSGTSMAAPHVSGAAALLISSFSPDIAKPDEMELYRQILKRGKLTKFNKHRRSRLLDMSIA